MPLLPVKVPQCWGWRGNKPHPEAPPWGEWSLTSKAMQVRAAAQSTCAARAVLLLLLLLQGQAGTAVISYLVKKHCFARTSYFQQFTQDCFTVAVCGYSCISSLLLMETASRLLSTWKRAEHRADVLPLHLLLVPDPKMQRNQFPSHFLMFLAETGHTRHMAVQTYGSGFQEFFATERESRKCQYNI